MALNAMPNEKLVEIALGYKTVALVGDHTMNENAWNHTTSILHHAGWRYHLVDPDHTGDVFNDQIFLSSVEEIRHYVPLIQMMDTTQKNRWFDILSYRMEIWGDIQMVWMHKGNAITQQDRDDAHAFGWPVIENECLANRLSQSS